MAFVQKVLLELINNTTIQLLRMQSPIHDGAVFQIMDRRGNINLIFMKRSYRIHRIRLNRSLTSKQIESFNSMKYTLCDLTTYSENHLIRLMQFIDQAVKNLDASLEKYAAVDSSGKVFAYSTMPAYRSDIRRWIGAKGWYRRFICKLDISQYTEICSLLFNIQESGLTIHEHYKETYIKSFDSDESEVTTQEPEKQYPGVSIVETETNTRTACIQDHIQSRIDILKQNNEAISRLKSQILDLQNNIDELLSENGKVNKEKNILITAANMIGIDDTWSGL
jgi:Mg2+ and Co2+ transporter CorA